MKIRSQIILAQLPAAIIILLITFFFIFSLTAIHYKADSILVDNFKIILSIQKFSDSAEALNNYVIRHPQVIDENVKRLQIKASEDLITHEKNVIESSEGEMLKRVVRNAWEVYKQSIDFLASADTIDQNYQKLKYVADNILDLNQDAIVRKKDELSYFIINYRLIISFSSFFILLFGFFISWVLIGFVLTPLKKMTEIVSQFGKTDRISILHIKGAEEIEKLSREFNFMTTRLEEYHQSSLDSVVTR